MSDKTRYHILSILKTSCHRSAFPFSEVFSSLRQIISHFVSQTLLNWSCGETTGSLIQGRGNAYLVLNVFLQSCSSLEFRLLALLGVCSTEKFADYGRPTPALEPVASIVHHPSPIYNVSGSLLSA